MKANATALGIAKGSSIKLTDLTTGKSLNVHVQSTGNHIDAEPLTSADTTTLCEIYGVSSPNSISYKRRPMMITTSAGQFLCSIYGQPHGAQDITNNGYDGQFCLHFVNSRTCLLYTSGIEKNGRTLKNASACFRIKIKNNAQTCNFLAVSSV